MKWQTVILIIGLILGIISLYNAKITTDKIVNSNSLDEIKKLTESSRPYKYAGYLGLIMILIAGFSSQFKFGLVSGITSPTVK